ncbi:MAG TPA: TetR/AcrR family transcriptional regulator [Ilumatobacteraceae bacterium]|nr:TetR/AcrR family transcriptional regulator [Ilumatobacteraceae bacterium]
MPPQPNVDGRRQRSARTRTRIVETAAGLFLAQGYLATTIEVVAEQAGVAVQTIYYVFGTKPNLLAAVLDVTIAGDAEPVPMLQRPWVEDLRAETNGTHAVQRLVDASTAIVARAAPIYDVVRQAAADAEVKVLLDGTKRRRRLDQRQLVEILAQSGHLRSDIDLDAGADIVYALINEEVFQLLTRDCGWSVDRFQRWASSLLAHQLVGVTASR